MANSDKDILITPSRSLAAEPSIVFTGFDNNPITLDVLDAGTLSFSGSAGELFSIADDLTGTIFSVNDISGIPSIEVDASGVVRLAEFSGNVLIGTAIDDATNLLQVDGSIIGTALESTIVTGTSPLVVTSTTVVTNLNADLLDGFHASAGESSNTIAQRNASGYILAAYFNGSGTFATVGAATAPDNFTGTNGTDTYGRSYTSAAAVLALQAETWTFANTVNTTGNVDIAGSLLMNGVSQDGFLYPYYQTLTLTAPTVEGWYLIATPGSSPKITKIQINTSGDNSFSHDEFIVSTSGYSFNHNIVHLPGTKYNGSKLVEVKTNNNVAAVSEIWIRVAANTLVGSLSVRSTSVIPTLVAATPTFGGTAITSLITSVGDRDTYSTSMSRGIKLGGTVATDTINEFTAAAGVTIDSVIIKDGGITLTTDLSVANGGTGASTFTDGGVLIGNVAGAVQATTAGTLGEVLTSNGAGVDPTFQAGGGGGGATVTDDTTTNSNWYPTFTDITSGSQVDAYVSSTQLTYNPFSGELTSIDFITTSDERLKENIVPIANALDTVNKLNGKEFDWKRSGKHAYGVIAQDIEKVIPDLVETDDDGMMKVHYLGIIGHLIEAVKELSDEVNKLKSDASNR